MTRRLDAAGVAEELLAIPGLSRPELIARWEKAHHRPPPKGISRRLLEYSAAYQVQVKAFGGLKPATLRQLSNLVAPIQSRPAPKKSSSAVKSISPGTRLVRDWHGKPHVVDVVDKGYLYDGKTYRSLSKIAHLITGTRWSGPRFFGL